MLKGKKVILKSIEKKDIGIIYNMMCDEEVRRYDGAYMILPSKEYILDNFDNLINSATKYLSIVNEKSIIIGYITCKEVKGTSNVYSIGITIGKNFWTKGYGQDSINTLLKHLFLNKAAQRVELEVVELNTKAISCYKKCGFKEEGKKRRWYFIEGKYVDLVMMGILKDEYTVR